MPRWPSEPTTTVTPSATVAPRMPAMKVFAWAAGAPMRMVLESPEAPLLPMWILLSPAVIFCAGSKGERRCCCCRSNWRRGPSQPNGGVCLHRVVISGHRFANHMAVLLNPVVVL